MEALIRLVQLVRRDSPANVVADDIGYRSPGDRRVALIAVATRRQATRRRRGATIPITEHPDVADREIRGAHMKVFPAHVPRADRSSELDVRVRPIASRLARQI